MIAPKRATGDVYEARALVFLQKQGLSLVARNWTCRDGEIDLVMREHATLVFVEVRRRASQQFGGALQSIAGGKSQRLSRAVEQYLARLPQAPVCRVDAVSFEGSDTPVWTKNVLG
jgi:putative endonuclease